MMWPVARDFDSYMQYEHWGVRVAGVSGSKFLGTLYNSVLVHDWTIYQHRYLYHTVLFLGTDTLSEGEGLTVP